MERSKRAAKDRDLSFSGGGYGMSLSKLVCKP